ncbi:MAG: SufS family cysteine desulfurase [Gemmataceae bacterium]|nr:SufS family cysteine desulfurase [Gemmataceae bacterium]
MNGMITTPKRPTRQPLPTALDLEKIRDTFPALNQLVHGRPLIYLDNAATSQKPYAVLDALSRYYSRDNANIHRAVHQLGERATRDYEAARAVVQRFLNAARPEEIIFVRGTTEAINLVASSFGRKFVHAGDEIVISHMEHHSNIVPWQLLCEATGAVLRVVPIGERGEFLFDEYEKLLNPRTKLVSIVHVSNSLGTINPAKQIVEAAHRHGIPVLLDGAQAVPHMAIDVRTLDCDFYAFSGHKVYGPTGIGVLYGKTELLEAMPPYQGGGDMIASVSFAKTTYNVLPYKFEAGTPNIAGVVGLGAALEYVQALGQDAIADHEARLLRYATEKLQGVPGLRIIGTAEPKAAVISFVVDDPPISALDLGTKLDLKGIAVRTGHHCCQPVMERFGVPATARASFALYNTAEEIDRLAAALEDIVAEVAARAKPTGPALVDVPFPTASAESPVAAAAELAELFEFLNAWDERYQAVLEMGDKLPPLPAAFKSDANRVHGCQSTVHLAARKRPGTADVLEFLGDSDADLVRGLVAVLERLFSGQRASEILAFDVEGFFHRIGLDQHLTLGRRNGLAAMVQRVRRHAAAIVGQETAAVG